jgi:opacity protein-like surface antigen
MLNWERNCAMRANHSFKFALIVLLLAGAALACPAAQAQTDVAASVYGAFNGTTSGNGVRQSPSNSAGIMIELRHISSPLVGYEATYSYNRANQSYTEPNPPCPTLSTCSASTISVPADAHELTGDWVVSLGIGSLRPFALAGGGLLLNVPTESTVPTYGGQCNPGTACVSNSLVASASTKTSTQGVFVYGAGLDWTVLPHLGLRFQYRGNLYKASDLTSAFSSTNSFTHTSEPMIGAYLRF